MKFTPVTNHDESELVDISKIPTETEMNPQPHIEIPPKTLHEEDPTSLWQYCIHKEHETQFFGLFLTMLLGFFYFSCFYAVIAQLVDMPPTKLATTNRLSNVCVIWISKIFFLIFLLVQAESECIDGWRMMKFAQGTRKTIFFFGFLQYFFGCLVEIISYALIHRSSTIFQLMSYSAYLTVFLRMDDVFLSWMTKMFPSTKRKVTYDKGRQEKDSRRELVWLLLIKLVLFIALEIGDLAGWVI